MKTIDGISNTMLRVAAIVALLLLTVAFLPNILYLILRTGGIELVQPAHVLGLNIHLSTGWFPIASNESMLGRILVPRSEVPTVLYYRNDWMSPWGSSILAVSRISKADERTDISKPPAPQSWKQFQWGEVRPLPASNVSDAIKVFLVPRYGLTIATKDVEALNAILEIASIERQQE